jgi:hypothetical protein
MLLEINVAPGQVEHLAQPQPAVVSEGDHATPLKRWRRLDQLSVLCRADMMPCLLANLLLTKPLKRVLMDQ